MTRANISEASILLHDIRSVHNVGSIFRTADAFGVKKIYLSGYTPLPVDRFGRKRKDMAKVALGAENSVVWEQVDFGVKRKTKHSLIDWIKNFKKETGAKIIALEQDKRSVDYRDILKTVAGNPILLIPGNEVDGISLDILDLADVIAEIPMRGKKESLNVAVAAGIALFALGK